MCAGINCSAVTRHWWAHAKDMEFNSKKDMCTCIRHNITVNTKSRGKATTFVKTATTKYCALCMREKISIFYNLWKTKKKKGGEKDRFLNARSEVFGNCACKTRFLRLCADVGNEGFR